ncbi:MAG: D-alanine--D-alanine ligase [Actinomycetia bacterium]|nr:D-alanine--D-alanine ligase [Actinomycetes bacterium]
MPEPPRIRLIVLFGGQSAEHDVSCVTAAHVLRAIDTDRFDVVPVGITREGEWVVANDARTALEAGASAIPDRLEPKGESTDFRPALIGTAAGLAPLDPNEELVVLPLLHGPRGEDGTVQGLLELLDLPYVGPGVLGSALTMDKAKTKEVLDRAGIPQARWVTLREHLLTDDTAQEVIDELGLPVFVKPANMGSSVGVSKANTLDEVRAGIETALRYDDWLVIEENVEGREIEIALLGDLELRCSVPGEIRPGADFYDYEDKYLDGSAELLIPAPLSDHERAELERLAIAAGNALRVEGMARADFFLANDGRWICNELNTIPGFTPISMYPQMWQASGLAYTDLITELIDLARARHARRSAKRDTGR